MCISLTKGCAALQPQSDSLKLLEPSPYLACWRQVTCVNVTAQRPAQLGVNWRAVLLPVCDIRQRRSCKPETQGQETKVCQQAGLPESRTTFTCGSAVDS